MRGDGASRAGCGLVQQYRLLLAKDLRLEMRTREMLMSMLLYSVLVLIVLGVAFALSDVGDVRKISAGLVWILIVFTAMLGLNHSSSHEHRMGALEGVLLAPVDRGVLYLSKLTSTLLFLGAVELIVLPLFFFMFMTGQEVASTFWWSLAPVVLGSAGLASVGTLLSAITSFASGKDVLLAVLFVPLSFPLLYACVASTMAAVTGDAYMGGAFLNGVVLAAAYDVVMALVSWLLYGYVVNP